VSGQLDAPAALFREKSSLYPVDRRRGGPQSRSRRGGEDKIIDPTGTRTPTPWSSSPAPVAIPTVKKIYGGGECKYEKEARLGDLDIDGRIILK
jgi:hypothetical protein